MRFALNYRGTCRQWTRRRILNEELDRIGQHQSYAKARYRVLKARYAGPVRRMIGGTRNHRAWRADRTRPCGVADSPAHARTLRIRARAIYSRMNMTPPDGVLRRPESAMAAEKLQTLLAEESGQGGGNQ